MKKQKNQLIGNMKSTIGLGVGSMAGMGAMGAMSSIPGMPAGAGNITGTVGASLGILNVGQLVKNTQSIMPKTNKSKKMKW